MREIKLLVSKDTDCKILFTDIEDGHYNHEEHGGIKYEDGIKYIHAIKLPENKVIKGVEVFREAYTIVGLGWMYGFLKYPLMFSVAEHVYGAWAVCRTYVTRGSSADQLIRQRNEKLQKAVKEADSACRTGTCEKKING